MMPTTPDRIHELASDWASRRNVAPSEVICAAVHFDKAVLERTFLERTAETVIDPAQALADSLQALALCDEHQLDALFMKASEVAAQCRELTPAEIKQMAKHSAKMHRLPVSRSKEVLMLAKMLYRLNDIRYAVAGLPPFMEQETGVVKGYLGDAAKIIYAMFTAEGIHDRTKLQTEIASLLSKIDRSESRNGN